ncbi:MAG: SHOCT domain-containing protein [Actinomycetota bacterium]|nr:SHOCT domain-containing protein [Actinomycetota bacterium]
MTFAQVVADAVGFDHMSGFGWWGMMGFGWLLGLAVVGVLVWAVVQATPRRGDATATSATRSAEAILADRFARGEIDDDEYRRRLDALRS